MDFKKTLLILTALFSFNTAVAETNKVTNQEPKDDFEKELLYQSKTGFNYATDYNLKKTVKSNKQGKPVLTVYNGYKINYNIKSTIAGDAYQSMDIDVFSNATPPLDGLEAIENIKIVTDGCSDKINYMTFEKVVIEEGITNYEGFSPGTVFRSTIYKVGNRIAIQGNLLLKNPGKLFEKYSKIFFDVKKNNNIDDLILKHPSKKIKEEFFIPWAE